MGLQALTSPFRLAFADYQPCCVKIFSANEMYHFDSEQTTKTS